MVYIVRNNKTSALIPIFQLTHIKLHVYVAISMPVRFNQVVGNEFQLRLPKTLNIWNVFFLSRDAFVHQFWHKYLPYKS